jgi:hypothetical protein
MGFEVSFKPEASGEALEEAAAFASFIVSNPKIISASPPIKEIAEIVPLPTNEAAPKRIIIESTSSTRICPRTTSGPASQPLLRETSMVAKSIGPGTRAPVSPIVKPRRRALEISSVSIISRQHYLGLEVFTNV